MCEGQTGTPDICASLVYTLDFQGDVILLSQDGTEAARLSRGYGGIITLAVRDGLSGTTIPVTPTLCADPESGVGQTCTRPLEELSLDEY